jgi:hypothetical protein
MGIWAMPTARFRTLCRSLEYWLTPVRVMGAKGDGADEEVDPRDEVLVLIVPSVDLIGGWGRIEREDFSGGGFFGLFAA